MIKRLDVVVPNLDRRVDRWEVCLKLLRERGFPDERITRFSAHDGANYASVPEMKIRFRQDYNNNLPKYLEHSTPSRYAYGWHRTWFEILSKIAQNVDNSYTLFLVDDWMIAFPYEELIAHIQSLHERSLPISCIQYAHFGTVGEFASRDWIVPNLVSGLRSQGDIVNIYSGTGATEILEYAQTLPGKSPETIFKRIAAQPPLVGHYSIQNGASAWGAERFGVSLVQDRRLDG